MKGRLPSLVLAVVLLALLRIACVMGHAEGAESDRKAHEPIGGIMDIALPARELGPKAGRSVRLLVDPGSKPPKYVFVVPGSDPAKAEGADPAQPFKQQMLRIGGEAVVYLTYYAGSYPIYVKILRYAEASEVEKQWSMRQRAGESEILTMNGREILCTRPGRMLRADLKAGMYTLEGREGSYWVRVAPADPKLENSAQACLLKQLEWIRVREPGGAANRSQPGSSHTNQPSAAPGAGR